MFLCPAESNFLFPGLKGKINKQQEFCKKRVLNSKKMTENGSNSRLHAMTKYRSTTYEGGGYAGGMYGQFRKTEPDSSKPK